MSVAWGSDHVLHILLLVATSCTYTFQNAPVDRGVVSVIIVRSGVCTLKSAPRTKQQHMGGAAGRAPLLLREPPNAS